MISPDDRQPDAAAAQRSRLRRTSGGVLGPPPGLALTERSRVIPAWNAQQCDTNQQEQSPTCKEQDFDEVGPTSVAAAEERRASEEYQGSNGTQCPARCFAKATCCLRDGGVIRSRGRHVARRAAHLQVAADGQQKEDQPDPLLHRPLRGVREQ